MTPKQKSARAQLRQVVKDQGRNFEKLFDLFYEHYKHNGPSSAKLLQSSPNPEREGFAADMMRAWNRGWDMWEAELGKRFDLQEKNHKRQAGISSANDTRQQKARADHQLYREVAKGLIAENPALCRATQHRLAQRVQVELAVGRQRLSDRMA
jgi:hypothetical protein